MSEIKAGDRVIYGRVPGVILMTHPTGWAWFQSDTFTEPYTVCLEHCQPEPPKPIEWVEAIPGKVLAYGDWLIRPDVLRSNKFVAQNMSTGVVCADRTFAEAKAYAEQKMREEDRRGV